LVVELKLFLDGEQKLVEAFIEHIKPDKESMLGREQRHPKLSEDLESVGNVRVHRPFIIYSSSKLEDPLRYWWWRHDDEVLGISRHLGFWFVDQLLNKLSSRRNWRWRNDILSLIFLFELLAHFTSGLSLLSLGLGGSLLLVGLGLFLGHVMLS
jgi:hypothetical protein